MPARVCDFWGGRNSPATAVAVISGPAHLPTAAVLVQEHRESKRPAWFARRKRPTIEDERPNILYILYRRCMYYYHSYGGGIPLLMPATQITSAYRSLLCNIALF